VWQHSRRFMNLYQIRELYKGMLKHNPMIRFLLVLLFSTVFGGCYQSDAAKYIKDLKRENIVIKCEAAFYLGEKEDEDAVPALMELLASDQPKVVRIEAATALGKIGRKACVDSLIGMMRETDRDIRIAAVDALGKIKDKRAARPIIDVLNDKNVRLTGIWALGNIGDPIVIPVLTDLLNDEDKFVRHNAARSLRKISING
jgi:HEAT repeat protein